MVDIAIIDYGVGNVKSLTRSLAKVGANVQISSDPEVLKKADALILPGVGAFKPAFDKLLPILPIIMEEIGSGKPLLGICLGYQLLFSSSTEGTQEGEEAFKGLNIIPGTVDLFPKMGEKIPHMGWNQINVAKPDHPLFKDIKPNSYVYFVHSFYGTPEFKEHILTETEYGIKFASAVEYNNVFGTQFHPEKSGKVGLTILKNFLTIAQEWKK